MAGSEVWEELGRGGERWLVERKFAEGEVIGQGDLRQGVVGWGEEVRGGLRASWQVVLVVGEASGRKRVWWC